MFDFDRESRAPRLFLDELTGQPIGGDDDRDDRH
jgi:hypothetical protein